MKRVESNSLGELYFKCSDRIDAIFSKKIEEVAFGRKTLHHIYKKHYNALKKECIDDSNFILNCSEKVSIW